MTELEDQILKVRTLREQHESTSAALRESKAKWTDENAVLLDTHTQEQLNLVEAEAKLRELTLAAYQATGSKKPAKGVGIRVVKSLQYDENSIKQWAIDNGHIMFLKVDRVGFEGWVKTVMKDLPKSLAESGAAVNEVETPQATIAKDLPEPQGMA